MTEFMDVDDGGGRTKKKPVDYPPNSHRSKEQEQKNVQKVVSGRVIERNKSLGRKIKETFTGDDPRSVWEFIIFEVAIPAAKTAFSEMVSQGTHRLLFGTSGPRYNRRIEPDRVSYGKFSESGKREISERSRSTHDFRDVLIETRGEAEDVLDQMSNLLDRFDFVTVADFYDLVGITSEFTDQKWGWNTLKDVHIQYTSRGYLLTLPRTVPLD